MRRYTYNTASVSASLDGLIGVGIITGVVSGANARQIIADSVTWGGGPAPLANLVNYQGAVVAIQADKLLMAAKMAGRLGGIMATPTAIVATADQIEMFRDYAELSMQAGVLKAAFTNPADARRWAARQAVIRGQWLQRRGVSSVSP